MLSAFVARCRIAFTLLVEDDMESDDPVSPVDAAPHGYDRVPRYAEPVLLEGGWSYTPLIGWELVPTVERGCRCPSCSSSIGRTRT